MTERAYLLGGTLKVHSTSGHGTTVTLEVTKEGKNLG
jgi:signal transduction histidine kinase